MTRSRLRKGRTVVGVAAIAVSAALLAGCTGGGAAQNGGATDTSTVTAPADSATPTNDTSPTSQATTNAGVVSLADAERAALEAVGDGRVTWSGPEDDLGAVWEIEVTRTDGREVDVLVAADGSVIEILERNSVSRPQSPTADDDNAAGSGGGIIDRAQAERIAVEAVGGGRVTWTGREDDRGAAWEIEVTRPDGSEVDVLIDAAGNVIR